MAVTRESLGEFEQLVLLAILRLGRSAYGVPIREEIESRTGRQASRAAIYITLRRLEKRGLVESTLADPTPERGGRAKRYFRVQASAIRELRSYRGAMLSMWEGLEPELEES